MGGIGRLAGIALVLAGNAPALRSGTLVIDHSAPLCLVANRFPILDARITPADRVARARIDFRADADTHWYFVEMKPRREGFQGTLPQPLKDTGKVHYYIEATDRALAESRTEEYASQVVESGGTCADPKKVAGTVGSASLKVGSGTGGPPLPPGFSPVGLAAEAGTAATGAAVGVAAAAGGGHATAILLAAAGAAAAAGGVVVAAHSGAKTEPLVTGDLVGSAQPWTEMLTITDVGCRFRVDIRASPVHLTLSDTTGMITLDAVSATLTLLAGDPSASVCGPCDTGSCTTATADPVAIQIPLVVSGSSVTGSAPPPPLGVGRQRSALQATRDSSSVAGTITWTDADPNDTRLFSGGEQRFTVNKQ